MKKKNKIKRFAPKFSGDYIRIGEKCRDCEYSGEPTVLGAKLKCTYSSRPKMVFRRKIGWVCYSFCQKTLGYDETRNENDLKTELTEA